MSEITIISQEQLKHLVEYDPSTGTVTWLNPTAKRFKRGDEAGNINAGRKKVKILGYNYPVARLAFLYMTGKYPELRQSIYHRDRDVMNVAWNNLKLVNFAPKRAYKPKPKPAAAPAPYVDNHPVHDRVRLRLSPTDVLLIKEYKLIAKEERQAAARAKWLASIKSPEEQAKFKAEADARNETKRMARRETMIAMQKRLNKQHQTGEMK